MLLATAAIVLVLWLPGFLVIHIGGAFIQILSVIAVIVVILHLFGAWVSGLTRRYGAADLRFPRIVQRGD